MDLIRDKLARCFALAFPQMDPSQYATASAANTSEWDSMAQVTLLTLIGEEFGIDVNFEEFEGATSFDSLASRINGISPGA
ncbi:MAG: acyl carrier protein [Acidobacteriota bacterium]